MFAYSRRAFLRATVSATAAAFVVGACGSDDSDSDVTTTLSEADIAEALDTGGTLTVWAWEPTLENVVEQFQVDHPNVTVELVNAGTGNDQYVALQNAISAGSGGPDVAQIEYYALPQFALAKSVVDLTGCGADDLEDTFTPGPWNSVCSGSGVYGLPMDSGPMALFYNKEVFDAHGVAVPTTWDEYLEAARTLHAADPSVYITSDTGDAGFTTSMIWQAGGRPYTVDGTDVGIDFSDSGCTTFTTTWQKLVDEELLSPVTGWSDEWYQGLGNGTIASLALGAWMPANLVSGVAAGSGKWRVAALPQWETGASVCAENGGSSLAAMSDSDRLALAYGFIKYATVQAGVDLRVDNGAFPATTAKLNSSEFLETPFEYFDGQQANQVFAEAAANVGTGWSYLPFQVYANSIYKDTVGQAYVSSTTLQDGLSAWQESCVSYGEQQGFTMR